MEDAVDVVVFARVDGKLFQLPLQIARATLTQRKGDAQHGRVEVVVAGLCIEPKVWKDAEDFGREDELNLGAAIKDQLLGRR